MALDLQSTTRFFFDRPEVQRRLDAGKLRVLSKFGSFVRRSSRSSIRKRKAISPPGQPPSSHRGDLKRLIFFAAEPTRWSVVIGPVLFARARKQSKMAQEALEYGGGVVREELVRLPRSGRTATGRQSEAYKRLRKAGRLPDEREQVLRRRQLFYRPRPFMGPAFAKELSNSKLSPLLRDFL